MTKSQSPEEYIESLKLAPMPVLELMIDRSNDDLVRTLDPLQALIEPDPEVVVTVVANLLPILTTRAVVFCAVNRKIAEHNLGNEIDKILKK